MAGVDTTNDESGIEVIEPLDNLTKAATNQTVTLAAILADQRMDGWEIVQLDGGSAIPQSQHIRFRLRVIIISRAVAGDMILTVGTRTFTFTVSAVPVALPFPLVIERGTDMSVSGDGRAYLIGSVE